MAVGASPMDGDPRLHIVCGLGHVGYRVALLLRRLGLPVSVIYNQASAEWLRDLRAAGATCIEGDVRDDRALERAGVTEAHAIIAATDQDLANLSVALDAKRMNSGIVTVVRLHDRALARHVEEGLGARQVLSTSALAAPAFISAALAQEDVGYFVLDHRPYAIVDVPPEGEPLAEDVLVLFEVPHDGAPQPADPSRGPAGPALAVTPARPARQTPRVRERIRAKPAMTRLAALASLCHHAPRVARLLLLFLSLLVVLGVQVIHATMGLSYGDAIYFAVTTVTTVGYGDFNFQASPLPVKLFGCLLMLTGGALLAALVGVVTDALVSYRLRDLLMRQPTRKQGHVVLVGGGHIGTRLAEQLARDGHDLVAVRPDAETLETEGGERLQVIQGDGRSDADLRLAGVEAARALVAVHEDDVQNLSIALQARKLNPSIRTVARVFDGLLAEKLQRELSIDSVLSVSAASAPAFVAAALHDGVLLAALWQDHLLIVREVPATIDAAGGEAPGVTLARSSRGRLSRVAPGSDATSAGRLVRAELLPLGDVPGP